MKIKTTLTLARSLALSAALAFVPATHAAVFTNGGFESPGGENSHPTGWTFDFNSYGSHAGSARTGSWGLHPGANANSGGRYQDFDTVPGTTYLVSAWAENFSSAAGTSHMDILIGEPGNATYNFPNANSAHSTTKFASGVTNNSFLVGSPWAEYTFNFTATATTTRIGIYNSYKTGDSVHSIDVDDVSVAAVPGPLQITSVSYDANNEQVTLVWDSVPGATYTLENTTQFVGNGAGTVWDNLTPGIPSGGIKTTNVVDFPLPGTYYRIRKE